MAKIAKEDFFAAILSSNILSPYLERDPDLAEMIKLPSHPDIHYFETAAPAEELAPTLKRRLDVMAAKNISHNREATKRLVAFMEEHPDSEIYNVTFNCPTRHYGVRCGLVNDQLHVICVMTGGHIPDELLGESLK
jgi:hypothetical protein